MSVLLSPSGRHLMDGTARTFLAGLLLPLTGLITAAFLTRRLGTDGYGLLVLAATLFGWFELSINALFSRATIKFVGEAPDWSPVGMTAIRLHVMTGAAGGLFLALLSFPLAWLLHEPRIVPYIGLYALHLPISSLSQAHQNILIGIGQFRHRALSNAGRWLARLVLILLLVDLGLSVSGAILGSLGAALIELAVARHGLRLPFLGELRVAIRPFYDLGLVLGVASLCHLVFSSLSLIMLKVLGGTIHQVGIYGAAQNLAILPGLFGAAFSPLLLSTVNRLIAEGKMDQAKDIGRGAMRIVMGLLPFGALAAGAAPEIVTWVFGRSFEDAGPILAWLIFGAVAFVMVPVAAVIATASGAVRFTLYLSGPLVLVAGMANYILIPSFGAGGGAMATVLCQFIAAALSVYMIHYVWSIAPPVETLWRSLVISALAYTLAIVWPVSGILVLAKLAGISAVILLSYLALREFSAEEMVAARLFLPGILLPSVQQQKR